MYVYGYMCMIVDTLLRLSQHMKVVFYVLHMKIKLFLSVSLSYIPAACAGCNGEGVEMMTITPARFTTDTHTHTCFNAVAPLECRIIQ